MRTLSMLVLPALLASCTYYVPVPTDAVATPPARPVVVVPAAPVYAYPYPYAYPYWGYPWFGSLAVGASFRFR
jgi:hypothetical protein